MIAETKCQELFKQIDELNAVEELQYGDRNLEEMGSEPVSKKAIATGIEKLNKVIKTTTEIRKRRKVVSLEKQIVEQQEKISKYEEQLERAQQRSGFSKTDNMLQ